MRLCCMTTAYAVSAHIEENMTADIGRRGLVLCRKYPNVNPVRPHLRIQFERRMERTPDLYAYLTGIYTPVKRLLLTVTGIFTGPMLVYHHASDDDGSKHSGEGHIQKVITDSFFDLSLKAAYSIPFGESTELELSIGVQNILDSYQRDLDSGSERDAAYIYGPSLPRTLVFGAKLSI